VKNAARERKFLTGQSGTSERHDHGASQGQDCGNPDFAAAVRDAKLGPDPANPDIPHITEPVIVKYVIDLAQLGLL
jgi:hypothetical protein